MAIKFEYKLKGVGWANSIISIGVKDIYMSVSYLSDALGDLTKALNQLFEGSSKVDVFFMSEPGEHRLSLARKSEDILLLKIDWFDDWLSWDFAEETDASTLLEAEISLQNFAEEVKKNLTLILDQYGLEGYFNKWVEHQFPFQDYEKLKKHLEKYDGK